MPLVNLTPAMLAVVSDEPARWWQQALFSPLSLFCFALLIVGVVGALLSARFLLRISRLRKAQNAAATLADDSGVTTIEFVMVLPILLFLILMLMQTTLVMGGNFFVHYAAFTATREAVTIMPTGLDATYNRYDRGSDKHEAIRRDAWLALVPVSGRQTSGHPDAEAYASAFASFYNNYGSVPPRWVENLLADRYRYAEANTQITVIRPVVVDEYNIDFEEVSDGYTFGYREPITVRVEHRLHLSIPLARAIFQDGTMDGLAYTDVAAHYTLTNEGVNPKFPPKPDLDRAN